MNSNNPYKTVSKKIIYSKDNKVTNPITGYNAQETTLLLQSLDNPEEYIPEYIDTLELKLMKRVKLELQNQLKTFEDKLNKLETELRTLQTTTEPKLKQIAAIQLLFGKTNPFATK
jgi:hypothetical protein